MNMPRRNLNALNPLANKKMTQYKCICPDKVIVSAPSYAAM